MAKIFYRYSCWWEDACSKCEWEAIDTAVLSSPKICYTEGYVINSSNKKFLVFVMTFQGQEVGEQMIIPKSAIIKLVKHKDSKFILEDMPYGSFKD